MLLHATGQAPLVLGHLVLGHVGLAPNSGILDKSGEDSDD